MVEDLKEELEKLREKIKNGVTSINFEKITTRDEFRRSLDVTDTFTPEKQSELTKRFEENERENSAETPHSLPINLIE